MKRMKKFASLLLALVMVLSLSTTVMAATINAPGETAGDKNAATETYTAYKIFDVTKTEDKTGYAYTLSVNSPWVSVLKDNSKQTWFTLTKSADGTVYSVTLKEGGNDNEAKHIAAYLLENKPSSAESIPLQVGANTVDDGYYLITSSLGSNLALATTDISVDITEKNTYPSLEKTADKTSASIGDTVTYTIKVNVPESADKEVVVHDEMSSGLSFVKFVSVTDANGTDITYKSNMNPDDECTFELTFEAADVAGKTVTIKYEATLNENAVINGEDGSNKNSAWLTYSEFKSTPSEPEVDTYKFQVVKTDNDKKVLDGAKFELYIFEKEGTKINLVKEDDSTYRVATAEESAEEGFTSAVIEAETATIEGLGNGTYYLEETVAPDGYNKLAERTPVEINSANNMATVSGTTYTDGGVQVVNQSGTELPSTGGMGTTIFYVIGSILVIGAAVLLVTRKRMSVEK